MTQNKRMRRAHLFSTRRAVSSARGCSVARGLPASSSQGWADPPWIKPSFCSAMYPC